MVMDKEKKQVRTTSAAVCDEGDTCMYCTVHGYGIRYELASTIHVKGGVGLLGIKRKGEYKGKERAETGM